MSGITGSILPDHEIARMVREREMITPFYEQQVRTAGQGDAEERIISYGLSAFGYDMRLSPKLWIFRHSITPIDPRSFNDQAVDVLETAKPIVLLPNSYALGYSMETFHLPKNIFSIVIGKSTYARAGIFINTTPMEPGWKGRLTLEIANLNHAPVIIYPGQGIAQAVFWSVPLGWQPLTTYADRKGKYQDQKDITPPKV